MTSGIQAVFRKSKLSSLTSDWLNVCRQQPQWQPEKLKQNKTTFLFQTWTSVRTTTTEAVSTSASTYLATTGAPAMMDSCWPTTDTTVRVRPVFKTCLLSACVSVTVTGLMKLTDLVRHDIGPNDPHEGLWNGKTKKWHHGIFIWICWCSLVCITECL